MTARVLPRAPPSPPPPPRKPPKPTPREAPAALRSDVDAPRLRSLGAAGYEQELVQPTTAQRRLRGGGSAPPSDAEALASARDAAGEAAEAAATCPGAALRGRTRSARPARLGGRRGRARRVGLQPSRTRGRAWSRSRTRQSRTASRTRMALGRPAEAARRHVSARREPKPRSGAVEVLSLEACGGSGRRRRPRRSRRSRRQPRSSSPRRQDGERRRERSRRSRRRSSTSTW